MPTSTEATVSAAVVAAIEGIWADLGFDRAPGNVKGYRFQDTAEEDRGQFLMSSVGGRQRVRVWSVWVTASDEYWALEQVMLRKYQIQIDAYYGASTNGDGAILIRDHATKVRGALRDLGSTLGGVVDRTEVMPPIQVVEFARVDAPDGNIMRGSFTVIADKRNPDF